MTSYICRDCLSKLRLQASPRQTHHPSHLRLLSRRSQSTTTSTSQTTKLPLSALTPSQLSLYWDTTPPDSTQLSYADDFFTPTAHSPTRLFSASRFRTIPADTAAPEVAFLGRSNVGKSSLLNAIMGKEMCWTSSRPGRTREMNAFEIIPPRKGKVISRSSSSRIVLLDMPGYGKASRTEWGVEILKYLRQRRQLRRTFLLIDSLHGPKDLDRDLLLLLREAAIPHQVIVSKADRVLVKNRSQSPRTLEDRGVDPARLADLQTRLHALRAEVQPNYGPGALGEILACSAETVVDRKSKKKTPLGISAIRWAILTATGFDGSLDLFAARVQEEAAN
ncbi:hypothetical protein VTN31DRAFT_5214 [Thermomyces dupontii]|uniref:uncharacterized protein n=1 Tax=Talaromyces thermophilus TaxID=28565 RepID=UPI0037440BB9